MVTDFKRKKLHLPVIPSANVVRERLREAVEEVRKLELLLRLACDLERIDASQAVEVNHVDPQ
jgi:hypothetical protein